MANTLADKYYLKAVEGYPYDLEESMESLQYALSYDEEHVGALYLMALFYMEQLQDFDKAEGYFQEALAIDPKNINVGLTFAYLNILRRRFAKAKEMLNYLATLEDVDKASLYELGALSLEYQKRYEEALLLLKRARLEAFNMRFMNELNESIERVKLKKKRLKKRKQ